MGRISAPTITAGVTLLVAVAVYFGAKKMADQHVGDVRNFAIGFRQPEGWKSEDHAPQTLFLYRHMKSNLLMRGAQNQVVSDVNPTPEMHGEGVANFYIETTKLNQKDWTARKLATVKGDDVDFHVIDRARKGKRVISAFGVKGNTTLIVSMSGNDKEVEQMETVLPEFEKFLASIEFEPTLPDENGRIRSR